MYLRLICVALVSSTVLSASAVGQTAKPYAVPRTADGHPDFQGVWVTLFITPLERPTGVEHLVADPEQARALVEKIRSQLPSLIDPDVTFWTNIIQLALVKGEDPNLRHRRAGRRPNAADTSGCRFVSPGLPFAMRRSSTIRNNGRSSSAA